MPRNHDTCMVIHVYIFIIKIKGSLSIPPFPTSFHKFKFNSSTK